MTQLILHRDETGESKRFAFVTYADKESTSACLEKLDGLEVAGKALAVRTSSWEREIRWAVFPSCFGKTSPGTRVGCVNVLPAMCLTALHESSVRYQSVPSAGGGVDLQFPPGPSSPTWLGPANHDVSITHG